MTDPEVDQMKDEAFDQGYRKGYGDGRIDECNSRPATPWWRTEPPTEPGAYWLYMASHKSAPDLVVVSDMGFVDTELRVAFHRDGSTYPLETFRSGCWLGPIPQPEVPKS